MDSGASCSANIGLIITATISRKAHAASLRRVRPIIRSCAASRDGEIWGSTDVYGVRLPLPGDSKPLVLGQVTARKASTTSPTRSTACDRMTDRPWRRKEQSDDAHRLDENV